MLKHILPFSQRQEESLEKLVTDKVTFTRAAVGNKRKIKEKKKEKKMEKRERVKQNYYTFQVKQSDRKERTNLY